MARDYNSELFEKMSAEQEAYKDELMQLSPSEILDKSFEYTWREEVLMSVGSRDLSLERAKALLKLNYPLDACYQEWKESDCDYLTSLRDCIDNRADTAIKENRMKADRESR